MFTLQVRLVQSYLVHGSRSRSKYPRFLKLEGPVVNKFHETPGKAVNTERLQLAYY